MSAQAPVVILFTDICDSSPLYARSGNAQALQLIGARLDHMTDIAKANHGVVIRSKGDDLLCTFEAANDAIFAARQMVAAGEGTDIHIRVGAHRGDVLNARGDIFGDAVNVAARLLEVARPDEIIVSESVAKYVNGGSKDWLRFFSRKQLKGQSEPTEMYTVIVPTQVPTSARTVLAQRAVPSTSTQSISRSVLALNFQGDEWVCTEGNAFSIGRSNDCDIVVPDPHVSREHATIELRDGKAVLSDHSSYGTWVAAQAGEILLRRESTILVGKGVISMGERIADAGKMVITYQQHRPS